MRSEGKDRAYYLSRARVGFPAKKGFYLVRLNDGLECLTCLSPLTERSTWTVWWIGENNPTKYISADCREEIFRGALWSEQLPLEEEESFVVASLLYGEEALEKGSPVRIDCFYNHHKGLCAGKAQRGAKGKVSGFVETEGRNDLLVQIVVAFPNGETKNYHPEHVHLWTRAIERECSDRANKRFYEEVKRVDKALDQLADALKECKEFDGWGNRTDTLRRLEGSIKQLGDKERDSGSV